MHASRLTYREIGGHCQGPALRKRNLPILVSREEIKIQGPKRGFYWMHMVFILSPSQNSNGTVMDRELDSGMPSLHGVSDCFLAPSGASSLFFPFGTLSLLRPLKYHQTPSNPERPVLHATFCYKALRSLSPLRHGGFTHNLYSLCGTSVPFSRTDICALPL